MSRDLRHRARHQGPSTFRCRRCRLDVSTAAPGTRHRNHCPSCLWSRHLDDGVPGDRAAACAASMEPIAVTVHDDGEWALVHRCGGCAAVRLNRIAGDDNPLALMQLAVRPLAQPPFPLEWLRGALRHSPTIDPAERGCPYPEVMTTSVGGAGCG